MIKISDLIQFNEKSIFDGAVQLDWVYDNEMRKLVAESYVFHGPKYHGVTQDDVGQSSHKLVDSATFVNEISKKLYKNEDDKNFIMAIASYGTGKSHLAVTMSSLFSEGKLNAESKAIINNIKTADDEIGKELESTLLNPNLIIAINGNKQANLNALVLKAAKESLKQHNISLDVLEDAEANIKTAKHFIEKSFSVSENILIQQTNKVKNLNMSGEKLKTYLLNNIEDDVEIFEIVNEAYKDFTGNYIRMEDTSSAGAILTKLNKSLVEEKKIFNKILIVFDEFGGFIEFAAQRPTVAGDSALQQIYEAVQNAKNNIIFIGFIQAELQTYISRCVGNPNIEKYMSRYRTAQKYFLSSNLETIFANLLIKTNLEKYKLYVENPIDTGLENKNKRIHKQMNRWFTSMKNKNVWSDYDKYKNVILKGCYPFHPLSTWILSNLSTWMQERSTIAYFSEAFGNKKEFTIDKGELDYIYPKDLISDSFISELKGSEDKGLQQSQYCNLYYNIVSEFRNKLSKDEIDVLKSILITNILNFKCIDKNDLKLSLEYCTGFKDEFLEKILEKLENDYGIILFSKESNQYEFSIEANGQSEYLKSKILKSRLGEINIIDILENDQEIIERLKLNEDITTHFGDTKNISSTEWMFSKKIINIKDITTPYINSLIGICTRNTDGSSPRGIIIYVYCNNETELLIDKAKILINETLAYKYPIVFCLLRDNSRKLFNAIKEKLIISKFTLSEKARFLKHYEKDNRIIIQEIQKQYTQLISKREILTKDGVSLTNKKLSAYCEDKLHEIYTKVVPFHFDGLEKKVTSKVKSYLETIINGLVTGIFENENKINELPSDVKNRINSLFRIKNIFSWKCLDENKFLIKSHNEIINEMLDEVSSKLDKPEPIAINGITLFKKYLEIPYGMNKYSLNVFIAYFIFINKSRIRLYDGKTRVRLSDITPGLFTKKSHEDSFLGLNYVFTQENSKEVFNNLIKELESVIFIKECSQYKQKINLLKDELDLDIEHLNILKALEAKIERGINLTRNEEKIQEEMKTLLLNLKKSIRLNDINALTNIAKIIINLNNYKNLFKKSEFSISDTQLNFSKEIESEINKFFTEDYLRALTNLKADSYTSWLKKKSIITSLIKTFKIYGYEKESVILNEKCNSIEIELQSQEKNKELLAQLDTIFKFNFNLENKNTGDLEYQLSECRKYKTTLQNSSLTKVKVDEYIKKIDTHINNINEELDKREKEVSDTILKFNDIKLLEELEDYYDLLITKKTSINNTTLKNKLDTISNEIKIFKSDINKLTTSNRKDFTNEISELEEKYNDKIIFLRLIKTHNVTIIEEFNNKNDYWIKNTLNPIKNNINCMTVQDIKYNINKLNQYPQYLNSTTIDEINKTILILEKRFNEFEVEGIIESFKSLSEEQQFECFGKIRDLFKKLV